MRTTCATPIASDPARRRSPRTTAIVSAAVLVATLVAGCGGATTIEVDPDPPATGTFRGGVARPGRTDALERPPDAAAPATAWTVDDTGPVIASPVAADGVAVIPLGDGQLVAVDATDGTVRWQVDIPDTDASGVVTGDHVVVVARDGTMAAHALDDGAVAWSVDLGGRVRSSPLLVDQRLVVGVGDEVVAVSARDGTTVWATPVDGRIDGSAALAGDLVVIGDTANQLWALEADSGDVAARVDLGPVVDDTFVPGIAATPTVTDDLVVVASTNGTVLAADPATLAARWTVDLGDPVYTSMAVTVDGTVGIVATAAGTVVALSLDGGEVVWEVDVGNSVYASPTITGDDDATVLALEEGGSLVGLDPANGDERWRTPVGEDGNYMSSTPIVVDGTIVVGTNTGDVVGLV